MSILYFSYLKLYFVCLFSFTFSSLIRCNFNISGEDSDEELLPIAGAYVVSAILSSELKSAV